MSCNIYLIKKDIVYVSGSKDFLNNVLPRPKLYGSISTKAKDFKKNNDWMEFKCDNVRFEFNTTFWIDSGRGRQK